MPIAVPDVHTLQDGGQPAEAIAERLVSWLGGASLHTGSRVGGVQERRLGLLVIACGCAPFAAGALTAAPGDGAGAALPCPFRAATGLPCPLCGASRAFALAARGDAGLWTFNAAWVVIAALAVLVGALATVGAVPLGRARDALAARLSSPARVTASIALALAVPWVYALTQRAAIS